MSTVSNAFDMSSAMSIVLSGGCFLLKPVAIVFVISCSAVTVENLLLKPCWNVVLSLFVSMSGNIIFSSVLAMGESSDMGLYDVPSLWFLLGLAMGIILASFQVCGISFLFIARLYSLVMYVIAIGPRCLRCWMFMLSGPVDLFVLLFCIAVLTCNSVIVVCVFCSLFVFLSMILLFLFVVLLAVFVNYLLNCVAMSFGWVHVLLLKVIVLFLS